MSRAKLLTATQIKKAVRDFTRTDLIALITDIAKACPQAGEYLTLHFSSSDKGKEVLETYREKVEYEFYPPRGFGRLNLREAKKAISDFRKICDDKYYVVDLMLFYVENCVRFTDDYGDIDEAFYNSACSMYESVVKAINAEDMEFYIAFEDRIRLAAENACEGWGFYDDMMDIYHEIVWLNDEEE